MSINIKNYRNSDIVHCSVPLLEGEVTGVLDGEVVVQNKTCISECIAWPVINGSFKVLVNLIPGNNLISLCCDRQTVQISLTYKTLNFKRFVRLIYIICQDDDGSFQAPPGENNSASSAVSRISLAAQMLQTFTSEKISSHGLKPKTFALEEEDGKPACHIFKSSLILEKALEMSENELWEHFALELMNSNLRKGNDCKFLAIMSFTRYVNDSLELPKSFKESKQMVKGYAALAAGGLALLGSACLHTWPQNLSEVGWRFGDTRRINQLHLMDDSCNRGWYWSCYASNLGATLHELGHVFDLGHTKDGIMSRGFDNIHRFFIVDLFYSSRSYQRMHNPHYQKFHHEKQHTVQLQKKPQISWTASKYVRNVHQNCKHKAEKSRHEPVAKVPISARSKASKSKPPWRAPQPMEGQLFSSVSADVFWARSSALILYYHKWFNDKPEIQEHENISQNGSIFTSPHGICIVEYRDDNGIAFHHLEFADGHFPLEIDVAVSLNDSSEILPETSNVKIHVQDCLGNICLCTFVKSSLIAINE